MIDLNLLQTQLAFIWEVADQLTNECDNDVLVKMKTCNNYGLDDTFNNRSNRDDCIEGIVFGIPQPCEICGDSNLRYR